MTHQYTEYSNSHYAPPPQYSNSHSAPPPQLLEKGCALYHRPVLRLLYEYMRLQDQKCRETKQLTDTIVAAVTKHVKVRTASLLQGRFWSLISPPLLQGPLWKEALDLLKLVVSNSASLVQPPTRGLSVDLGHFTQTLPGPTLQFTMDLQVQLRAIMVSVFNTVTCTSLSLHTHTHAHTHTVWVL